MKNDTQSGTALALPAGTSLEALLKTQDGAQKLLDQAAERARAEAAQHNAATAKGRAALVSLANKASNSRAEAKRQAMALTEQWRKDTSAVNAGRKILEDGLAALRDEIRQPVTEWETAEKARVDALKGRLERLRTTEPEATTSQSIAALIAKVEAVQINDEWQEYAEQAETLKENRLTDLRHRFAAAEKAEADAAELEELRALKAKADADQIERERAEAQRAEEEMQRQQAEAKRIADEKAEADRIEATRKAEADRKRLEQAAIAKAAQEAEERAAQAAKEAEERHAKELQDAKDAAAAEVKRLADAEAVRLAKEVMDQKRRDEDKEHRRAVNQSIVAALGVAGVSEEVAKAVIIAINRGDIPHTKITY